MEASIKKLRKTIRYASKPDSPQLIQQWLKLEAMQCDETPEQQWEGLEASIRLLLDVLADEILPAHWRATCLDYIHLPLGRLNQLVEKDDDILRLNRLIYEIRVTSHFFNPAITGPVSGEDFYGYKN